MKPRHKDFSLNFSGTIIKISSNFDSGNLQQAQIIDGKLILTPSLDPMNPQYSTKQSSKTFFHFNLQASNEIDLPIIIKHMKILEYFSSEEQFEEYYRICIGRREKKGWRQVIQYEKVQLKDMRRIERETQYELHFTIRVKQEIYLAYHYPYSFQKIQHFLQELKEKIDHFNLNHQRTLYYTNQLLIQSLERRPINLLTITASNNIQEESESRVTKSIFPYYEIQGRPKKFNKPYIMLTCRVHSGETSSSFALQGIIDLLISSDKRAEILRQNFVFLIVPVINPDGVFHGTYRMDTLGHNLNRFYNSAQSHKQPAIFAIQVLANYYSSRIIFFMDLHSHPHPNKGSFIYGNCLAGIQDQTQNQLYAKILSAQSECFGYNWCNFSTNQMNSRDMNQLLTKDGSARVQLYKILNIPFSYTMEMGYHGCNPKRKQQGDTTIKDYRRTDKIFSIIDYKSHGRSILLSILTLFQINSSNGGKTETGKYYQNIREQMSKELLEKEERFRQNDSFAYKKIKIMQELIYEQIYQPIFKKFPDLENSIMKKIQLQKKPMIHTISQNASIKKVKNLKRKDLSLNMRQISKTIQASTTRQKAIQSFKSEIQQRLDLSNFQLIDSRQDSYAFAKMLNLDFNPFPSTEKKKIYNIVGNRRSYAKRSIIGEIQNHQRNIVKGEIFDIETIDVNSQIQLAERNYKNSIKYEIISTNRNKVMSNFNQNTYIDNEEEDGEYNDGKWEKEQKNIDEHKFILPRISQPAEKTIPNFNIEVQIQQQYERKYNIREQKEITPAHYKMASRNHSLKMRSLMKANKL